MGTIITEMPNATIISDEQGVELQLHGMGKPDNDHEWLNIEAFRRSGTFTLDMQGTPRIKYGTVVVTSHQVGTNDSLKYVGYVVQIRRGAGEYHSDEYFIRHPDGVCMRHSNQSFYILCAEDAEIVLSHSESRPEDEGGLESYTKGQTQDGKGIEPEAGFDIPRPTTGKAD